MDFNKLGMDAASALTSNNNASSSEEDGNRLAQQELKTLQSLYTYGNKLSKSTKSDRV